jgi:hypothetical protein
MIVYLVSFYNCVLNFKRGNGDRNDLHSEIRCFQDVAPFVKSLSMSVRCKKQNLLGVIVTE